MSHSALAASTTWVAVGTVRSRLPPDPRFTVDDEKSRSFPALIAKDEMCLPQTNVPDHETSFVAETDGVADVESVGSQEIPDAPGSIVQFVAV